MVDTSATGRPFPGWEDVAEDIIPKTDETYDLGSDTKKWYYLYAVIAILTSMTLGGIYLGATAEGWLFINASTQMNGSLAVNGSGLIWEDLTVIGTNVSFANANVTASYYLGDGSLLTGIQHGDLIFFMHNETSADFPSSRVLKYLANDTGQQSINATVTADGFEIVNFTTDDGIPGLQILPDGVGHVHFHAKKATGTKNAQIYYQFYKVDTSNVSTLISTSELSDVLTGSSVSYNIHSTQDETLLASTDRLRVLLLADESGSGTDAQIEIYVEGVSGTRIEIPGPVASTANFVPYTGAIKNLDLGAWNITADYFIGNGSQLTDITLTETDPYWTANQSSYFNTTDILGFNYWNSTFATFNKTYADTLYYDIGNSFNYWNSTFATFNKTYADTLYSTILEPLWAANSTLVPYLASANVFTANQNLTSQNISTMDCIIFDSGGKICSGV